MKLLEEIQNSPKEPGVYLFQDLKGNILYIGKAKNLRKRLQNYLHPHRDGRPQIQELLERAFSLKYIVTETECEALLLEQELIYRHTPPYNILFRHERSYISLKIRLNTPFPPLEVVRKVCPGEKALYLGPFPSPSAVRETLDLVLHHFQLRSCSDAEFKRRKRPCLLYQMGKCSAPCVEKI